MGMCLVRPLGLAPAEGGLSGLLRGGDESVPALASEPSSALGARPRPRQGETRPMSHGQLQERGRHRSDENLGAGSDEGEAAARNWGNERAVKVAAGAGRRFEAQTRAAHSGPLRNRGKC